MNLPGFALIAAPATPSPARPSLAAPCHACHAVLLQFISGPLNQCRRLIEGLCFFWR